MGGIAIVLNRDGRPVDPALLERMVAAMVHRGPDGTGQWVEGPVAMGAAMLWTTPEAVGERQPLVDEEAGLALVMDGRVDNREELKEALLAHRFRLRSETDAELVLRAYEAWGEESAVRILGDFAYAIWDRRRRELFCARDVAGIRPFYYYLDDRTFLAGSELRQILEDPRVALEPNEETVALYLADSINDLESTLYRRISRLPPGHYLVLGPQGTRKRRYYDPEPRPQIHYRTDREYAEHFRELLREAVRRRMRATGVVGSQLSGGLDSSLVTATAHSLIRSGTVKDVRLESFSLVFADSQADESDYISDVVRMWGLDSNLVPSFQMDRDSAAELARRYRDFPGCPNGIVSDNMRALARNKQVRVMLSGLGGDDWFWPAKEYPANLLLGLRFRDFARHLAQMSRSHKQLGLKASLPRLLVTQAAFPVMPPFWRQLTRRVLGFDLFPVTIKKEFARRIGLTGLLRREPPLAGPMSFAQRWVRRSLYNGHRLQACEIAEREDAWFGIEKRHPFWDRRIMEFALAIPEEQRYQNGRHKFILEQAAAGLLPESVRKRRKNPGFTGLFIRAFELMGGEQFLKSLAVAETGWVDTAAALTFYRDTLDAFYGRAPRRTSFGKLWPLWFVFALEVWFREIFVDQRAFAAQHYEPEGRSASTDSRGRSGGVAVWPQTGPNC